jgi:hypothetical protein
MVIGFFGELSDAIDEVDGIGEAVEGEVFPNGIPDVSPPIEGSKPNLDLIRLKRRHEPLRRWEEVSGKWCCAVLYGKSGEGFGPLPFAVSARSFEVIS